MSNNRAEHYALTHAAHTRGARVVPGRYSVSVPMFIMQPLSRRLGTSDEAAAGWGVCVLPTKHSLHVIARKFLHLNQLLQMPPFKPLT